MLRRVPFPSMSSCHSVGNVLRGVPGFPPCTQRHPRRAPILILYLTSIERIALEEGRQEGRQEGLQEGETEGLRKGIRRSLEVGLRHRFGAEGEALLPQVHAVQDAAVLEQSQQALWSAGTLEEFRRLLSGSMA
jgi:hypothetical protein